MDLPIKILDDQLPTIKELTRHYTDYVLSLTNNQKTKAAKILGINRRTLYRKSKQKVA